MAISTMPAGTATSCMRPNIRPLSAAVSPIVAEFYGNQLRTE